MKAPSGFVGRFVLGWGLVLLLVPRAFGVNKVATTAAQFLKIGVGARAVGMGGAFVAVANDATALYWNPGGIARLPRNELVVLHTSWLADVSYDFAGLTLNLGNFGTVGASLAALNMGEMEVRTEQKPEGTGELFDAGDFVAALSWGRSLTDRFSIGFNFKYIHQSIWRMSASGFAFDIGTLFTTQFHDMRIGMSISNFGTEMQMRGQNARRYYDINPEAYGSNDRIPVYLETERWPLPLLFRVGIAMDLVRGSSHRLTAAVDAVHPNDNVEHVNLGAEYTWLDMVSLRVGFNSVFDAQSEQGLTAGGGIRYPLSGQAGLRVDYAYADFGRFSGVHRFSLALEF
ncbi:MAG: PorV/PorQ family protein [candidate division KSB1 bacterium]|nr:PorV/PorQ family protein [candidate division KSB1 bacterium]